MHDKNDVNHYKFLKLVFVCEDMEGGVEKEKEEGGREGGGKRREGGRKGGRETW